MEQADGLDETGDLIVALAITAVLVAAGLAIPGTSVDVFRRMKSVLWFAATIAWAAAVNQFLSSVLDLDPQGDALAILTGVVATAGASIFWLGLRRSLQLIGVYGTAFATLAAFIDLTREGFEPSDPNLTAVAFWVFGMLWALSADRAILRPVRTGLVLGTLTAIIAPYAIATPRFDLSQTTITAAAVWSFATSAIALAYGGLRGDRAVQGIAIAGVILGAGVVVGSNVSDSNAESIVALVVGLAVFVAALVAIRLSRSAARPAAWAPPPPPPAPPPAP